jgi:hopanoid-associated phosphorylase
MLGIVAALSWELKSLTRETIAPGAWKAISPQVLAALSGIGAESADDAAALLIGQGATALISWGYAAALDKGLKAGSLVLPERVIGAGGESYAVDAEWHQRLYLAAAYNVPVRIGALVQSEAVVKTAAEKRALAERTGAVAADMESAAHARAAARHGLPFVAVRSIIDTASTDIPETVLQALDAHGGLDAAKLLRGVGSAPADWIKMLRLCIQFSAAQKTLKKAKRFVLENSPA